jgi:hypothetical protein
MNKLNIPNGGMPLDGDDFEWVHSGLLEAFKGVLHPFLAKYSGNAILSGCVVSFGGGLASVTEGWVAINYEVCFCPAQTVAVASLAASSLKIAQTYDVSGLEVFADSVARDTYLRRRAAISDGLSGSNEIVLDAPARFTGEISITSFLNSWVVDTGSAVKARIFNGIVSLEGVLTGGNTNLSIFNLPAGFRPSAIRRSLALNSFDLNPTITVSIFTDGDIVVYNDGGEVAYSSGQKLYLDTIQFRL